MSAAEFNAMMGMIAFRYSFTETELWAMPGARLRYWFDLAVEIAKGMGA